MMRAILVGAALLGLGVSAAMAAPGDSWILPIHHRDGGGWNELAGAGYGGASAWQASGPDGVRRAYWELDGVGVPTTTELYTIQVFAPTAGAGNWQPIESQFKGVNGETYPVEPLIPWVGAWGTNHQYIGSDFGDAVRGTFVNTGAGPHTPESADYNAGAGGTYMWLTKGSWLYAKWDYGWSIDRAWSAIKLTQVTPEPTSMILLALGGAAVLRRKSRA